MPPSSSAAPDPIDMTLRHLVTGGPIGRLTRHLDAWRERREDALTGSPPFATTSPATTSSAARPTRSTTAVIGPTSCTATRLNHVPDPHRTERSANSNNVLTLTEKQARIFRSSPCRAPSLDDLPLLG